MIKYFNIFKFINLRSKITRTMDIEKSSKIIGTHSGAFHIDEVLACTMLRNYTKEFKDASITRTRDDKLLARLDIVVDVGGIYNPSNQRYDHHQKEFQEPMSKSYDIRLSSAGLIYRHFGREVVTNLSEKFIEQYKLNLELTPDTIDKIYWRLYDKFILAIDAIDNGVNQYPNEIKPKYVINTNLGHRISRLNPSWGEEDVSPDDRFHEAMKIADEEIRWQVKGIVVY